MYYFMILTILCYYYVLHDDTFWSHNKNMEGYFQDCYNDRYQQQVHFLFFLHQLLFELKSETLSPCNAAFWYAYTMTSPPPARKPLLLSLSKWNSCLWTLRSTQDCKDFKWALLGDSKQHCLFSWDLPQCGCTVHAPLPHKWEAPGYSFLSGFLRKTGLWSLYKIHFNYKCTGLRFGWNLVAHAPAGSISY